MKILFDITHPAHFHLFKYAIEELRKKKHKILITARKKDVLFKLFDNAGLNYLVLARRRTGFLRLSLELVERDIKMYKICRKFKPDLLVGTSANITHIGKLTRKPSVVFNEDDADVVNLFTILSYPFATIICTPKCLRDQFTHKYRTHNSYHELAYLHPNRFRPDENVLEELGVDKNERYFIVRFVSLKAAHDKNATGINLPMQRRLINILKNKGKVFITSEGNLSRDFMPFQMKLAPEKMHSALFFATLFIGDSQTMAAEAAVLGTPAIRCNTFVGRISYLEELEHKYGLTSGFLPGHEEEMFEKINKLLNRKDLKEEWQKKRQTMLIDKIDLTKWMVDLIERMSNNE